MKPYRTALAATSLAAASMLAHGQPAHPRSICDIADADANGALTIRAHVTPTMHAGLQLTDTKCPGKLLELRDKAGDPAQKDALSRAFAARLYERPYALVISGQVQTLDGRRVFVATGMAYEAGNP
ncbi:hypothetical protein KPL74_15930 [Bacillus sp. NP157]|nr:hypothetical protein KPL74_15930 [Bacillus sp. NP157]